MRIAFVHNRQSGGARRTMAEHMARVAGEVTELCLATATPVRDDAHVVALRPRAPGVHPLLRPPLRYADLAQLLLAWRRLGRRLAALSPDVVVAHPCRFVQAPPVLARSVAPTLYFCHEFRRVDHEAAAEDARRRLTRAPYAAMYAVERATDTAATRAASRVVTNSRYTAAGILRAYDREAEVLPLGVGAAFTAPPDRGAAEPRTRDEDAGLLSVGSLIPSKGHDLVIAAAARATRRRPVTIVTPVATEAETARLHALAAASGVALEIRTAISDEALRDCYRAAFATLYLAVAEPLGLVSLEAQACGCPVIVSAEGGLPETVRDGATGWAVPRTAEAAATRLDALEDPALRARMASAAVAHGGAYTWDASTRALERALPATLRR